MSNYTSEAENSIPPNYRQHLNEIRKQVRQRLFSGRAKPPPDLIAQPQISCDWMRQVDHSQVRNTAKLAHVAASCFHRDRDNGKIGPSVDSVITVCAAYFNIQKADILGGRRFQKFSVPRQIAAASARALTDRSLPEIGRAMGGLDHSTVLHAARKLETKSGDKLNPSLTHIYWRARDKRSSMPIGKHVANIEKTIMRHWRRHNDV